MKNVLHRTGLSESLKGIERGRYKGKKKKKKKKDVGNG